MDEFEIFKARATGCEINIEDLEASEVHRYQSSRSFWRTETIAEEPGKPNNNSNRRKSMRRSSRRIHEEKDEGLQVKVEIQPPSPVVCRRQCDDRCDPDRHSLSPTGDKYNANGSVLFYEEERGTNSEEIQQPADLTTSIQKIEHRGSFAGISSNMNARRTSRHSFTGSHRGDSLAPSDEFGLFGESEELEKFRRTRSCRSSSGSHKNNCSKNNPIVSIHTNPSDISNEEDYQVGESEVGQEDDDDLLKQPAVYRVRSFTTKKGEIINRGDSFKICSSGGNRNLLYVGDHRSPGQRRCSAAVQGGSFSRLEVCSLSPGANSLRRSSFTCLATNHLGVVPRRGSSEHRRVSSSKIDALVENPRKQSLASVRKISHQDLVDPTDPVVSDHWSNNSGEGTLVEEVECFENEEVDYHPPHVCHVTVLGYPGVGKTTLINQLMTSEYLANKEQIDQGEDDGERVVSVFLDDIESTVHFHEGPQNLNEDNSEQQQPDVYLLIFSVTERNSFSFIQTCLRDILKNDKRFHHICSQDKPPLKFRFQRHKSPSTQTNEKKNYDKAESTTERQQEEEDQTKPVKPVLYLVANKQDLVRNRVVSEAEVKRLVEVKRNSCRYVEVSALLDHKIDEVLVGIVREVRRRANKVEDEDSDVEDTSGRGCLQQAVVGFCGKLFK